MISYAADGIAMPRIHRRTVTKWIHAVAKSYGREVGDIAYMFVNDERIIEINRQFLHHDYFTDIITFDYDELNTINGDIAISVDTVKSNARALGKAYIDELHRVIIHGILHLCGINDKAPGEREIMEAAEDKALALLADIVSKETKR